MSCSSRAVERLPLSGRGRARVARVARTAAALAGRGRRCSPSMSPRRSRTARRRSSRRERARARLVRRGETTRTSSASRGARASRPSRRASTRTPSWRGSTHSGFASSLAPTPASRRCSGRSTIRRQASSSAAKRDVELLAAPGGRDRRRARLLGVRPPGRAEPWPRPRRSRPRRRQRPRPRRRRRGASRRAGGRAARLSPCSAAASTATTPPHTASWQGRSRRRGSLVSEYAPGVEPAPWRFPARNRIVAGLCAATVVVEARERSGALITADFALEEGREVLAVPGEITSRALGRVERAAAARSDSADLRPGCARGLRAGRRRRSARPSSARRPRPCSSRCERGPRAPTSSHVRPGFPPASWLSR